MSADLYFRTEDIPTSEILAFMVESRHDREIIDALKGRSPVILRGSRGVGKSFLLRAAEVEMEESIQRDRILPVYITFERAQLLLLGPNDSDAFLPWMIAKICGRILRAATRQGLAIPSGTAIGGLSGSRDSISEMERVGRLYENAWKSPIGEGDVRAVPGPDALKDAVEDLCARSGIKRVCLLVDEAAHVFIPEQQRQFFTLMRDLRSPYISVKAAVYPGATSFGDSFQLVHDATELTVDRNISDGDYISLMRQLIEKQDRNLANQISQRGEEFDTLAYAATGNPRILLKTLSRSTPFNRRNVQEVIRSHFRNEIWSEHSNLGVTYPGHRDLIDWGRKFVESWVLPALHARNEGRSTDTSTYLWIHRDAPEVVKQALRLLCYSGILQEGDSGIRATRSEPGTRYVVNFGCQIALDADPLVYGNEIRRGLSVRRMVEFGANHPAYAEIAELSFGAEGNLSNEALRARLQESVEVLELTRFLRLKLQELGLNTVGEVLAANEEDFMEAHYVGPTRARQMRNAASTAVFEYLSG